MSKQQRCKDCKNQKNLFKCIDCIHIDDDNPEDNYRPKWYVKFMFWMDK